MNKTKVELTDTGIFVQILNPLTGRMEWKSQPEDYDYQQELARAAFAGQLGSYLWGILGQWDFLLLNLTSIGFTDFFRCLIPFLFTNADIVTIKDETSKENLWNRCRSYWLPLVSQICFRCLIFEFFFFTNAHVVTIKDETSK